MRPGQQNKRGRGRGSNNNGGGGGGNNNNNNGFNRKGGNPLTRSYDSSGPDVKIRGTAQHIAEKYATLARDAQSSGDRVMAENYLQHAEHYNRIIASAQAQMQERFQRDDRSDYNERDTDSDDTDGVENEDGAVIAAAPQQPQQPQPQSHAQNQNHEPRQPRQHQPRQHQPRPAPVVVAEQPPVDGTGPQPVIEGTPVEVEVAEAEQASEATARAPARRRATNPRPRRPRRTAGAEGGEGGEGQAEGGSDTSADTAQPSLADVPGE